jgi:hypothetical protein
MNRVCISFCKAGLNMNNNVIENAIFFSASTHHRLQIPLRNSCLAGLFFG